MMVMMMPAVMAAEVVTRPPEPCVRILVTIGSVVISLVVNSRRVVRARFHIDRCGLVVVVAFDDAGAFDYARGRVFVTVKVR